MPPRKRRKYVGKTCGPTASNPTGQHSRRFCNIVWNKAPQIAKSKLKNCFRASLPNLPAPEFLTSIFPSLFHASKASKAAINEGHLLQPQDSPPRTSEN